MYTERVESEWGIERTETQKEVWRERMRARERVGREKGVNE